MNKLVKGSIAAATGIALLMGGAGSLALWNDSASVAGGTITAGTLTVAAATPVPSTDGWKNNAGSINIASYRVVPGETLTYTKTMTVTAIGDRLTANVSVDTSTVTPATAGNAADIALAGFIQKNATFTVNGGTAVVAPATASITATPTAKTVVVTVSITFPSGAAGAENSAKNGAVNLIAFAVNVVQTAVTP
jgi:alternate signal-mediated exported protein